jgi:threonine synthase
MGSYGATIVRGGRQDAMVRALVARGDWFPSWIVCPRAGFANPFGIEGFKTIAFEIHQQLGGVVPDRVFVPVGSGDGIYGIWKGFVELQRTGQSDRLPRMYACQATGANPYVRAFRDGKKRLTPVDAAHTVALSIEEKIGGELALSAVYESGGAALDATDDEIILTARCLAREGLALESASAAAVTCASKLSEQGCKEERWLAIGTGAAIKWPQTEGRECVMPEKLPPNYEEVSQLILDE